MGGVIWCRMGGMGLGWHLVDGDDEWLVVEEGFNRVEEVDLLLDRVATLL